MGERPGGFDCVGGELGEVEFGLVEGKFVVVDLGEEEQVFD